MTGTLRRCVVALTTASASRSAATSAPWSAPSIGASRAGPPTEAASAAAASRSRSRMRTSSTPSPRAASATVTRPIPPAPPSTAIRIARLYARVAAQRLPARSSATRCAGKRAQHLTGVADQVAAGAERVQHGLLGGLDGRREELVDDVARDGAQLAHVAGGVALEQVLRRPGDRDLARAVRGEAAQARQAQEGAARDALEVGGDERRVGRDEARARALARHGGLLERAARLVAADREALRPAEVREHEHAQRVAAGAPRRGADAGRVAEALHAHAGADLPLGDRPGRGAVERTRHERVVGLGAVAHVAPRTTGRTRLRSG